LTTEVVIKIRKDDGTIVNIDGTVTRNKFIAFRKTGHKTMTYKGWFLRIWKFFINIQFNTRPFP